MKEWLRVDTGDSSQDNVITLLITAAREAVEAFLSRKLITQTLSWEMSGRDLTPPIWLPFAPAQSITSLKTYDTATDGSDDETTVDSGDYQLVEGSHVAYRDIGWEINRDERAGVLVYVAGYGDAATDVPYDIRTAILKVIAWWYENRDEIGTMPQHITDDLATYRYQWL